MDSNLDLCLMSPCVIWEAHQILNLPYLNSPAPTKQIHKDQSCDNVCTGKDFIASTGVEKSPGQNACIEISQYSFGKPTQKKINGKPNESRHNNEFLETVVKSLPSDDEVKEPHMNGKHWGKGFPISRPPDFEDLEKSLLQDSEDELAIHSTFDLYEDENHGEEPDPGFDRHDAFYHETEESEDSMGLDTIDKVVERDFIVALEKNEPELICDKIVSFTEHQSNVEEEKTYADLNVVPEPGRTNQDSKDNHSFGSLGNRVSNFHPQKDVSFNLLLGAKKRLRESSAQIDLPRINVNEFEIKEKKIDFIITDDTQQVVTDDRQMDRKGAGEDRVLHADLRNMGKIDALPEVQAPELVRDLTNGGLITTLRPNKIGDIVDKKPACDEVSDASNDKDGIKNNDTETKTEKEEDDKVKSAVDTYFKNQMIHSFINRTVFNTILGNRHLQQVQQQKAKGLDENLDVLLKSQYKDILTADGKREFQCNICTTVLPTKSKLRVHMRRHSTHKPYKCPTCDRRFGFKSHLSVHIRTHTGEKPFKCDKCGKPFTNNGDLTRHERTHTGEKPYQCNICGKKFSTNGTLTVHTRRHTGERPYECKYCGKLFTNNSDLSKHERTHRSTKSFTCNACGQNFMSKSDLTKHERTYTGERPFKCKVCDKRFTTNGSLTVHTRTHTGERPYTCKTCGKQFHSNSNLTVHLKSHERIRNSKRI